MKRHEIGDGANDQPKSNSIPVTTNSGTRQAKEGRADLMPFKASSKRRRVYGTGPDHPGYKHGHDVKGERTPEYNRLESDDSKMSKPL